MVQWLLLPCCNHKGPSSIQLFIGLFETLQAFSSLQDNENHVSTRLGSAVGNVFGNRCVSDCRSRGLEFDSCPGPYFRGD